MEMKSDGSGLARIRQLDLAAWLEDHGLPAVMRKKSDTDYWYLSPLREEKTASFHVNRLTNEWYDFGLMAGGNPVDFFLRYFNCSIPELLLRFGNDFSVHQLPVLDGNASGQRSDDGGRLMVKLVHPIFSYPLKAYLHERSIPLSVAQRFCKEVSYAVNGRQYYGIGFQNDAGGWEIRNRHFKYSSAPKDITTLAAGATDVKVFEGFFDFLSWQCLHPGCGPKPLDFVILNGAGMFDRALPFLKQHQHVGLWLDRDVTGRRYTEYALSLGAGFKDESALFSKHKDLNDWLVHQAEAPQVRLRSPGRLGLNS
jgi:hypothetical protein